MKVGATTEMIGRVKRVIEAEGVRPHEVPSENRMVMNVIGNVPDVIGLELKVKDMEGVKDVKTVSMPYRFVSREFKEEDTVIDVGGVLIGGKNLTVIAGPCAVETEEQTLEIAHAVKRAGANVFRGGAFKPRTDPNSFQGLGERGLEILSRVRQETGLPVVTEIMDTDNFELVEAYTDILQIGTRNMQNFSLLRRAGKARKPVILKRGLANTLEEWLMSAEYIVEGGNSHVILCERGIRTMSTHSRNTLDLHSVLAGHLETHLPIIVDPSHAAGKRYQVIPLALAAMSVGANGIMVEVHNAPENALCDGPQSLRLNEFADLMTKCRQAAELGGKTLFSIGENEPGRLLSVN
ncbi:MAG: 3-deoxy-7-phosphoheptulonate synthase [Deltaproteobacteria bacterium]|nr:3-deoxy-7-phosphoheptulonate synthase [Deltaproteobacteria bacterium]